MVGSPDDRVFSWNPTGPDNITIAIYAKLNELAERHGLKPYDFVATVRSGPGDDMALAFEWPAEHHPRPGGSRPPQTPNKGERYDRMLRDLGIPERSSVLVGTDAAIVDALDNALQRGRKPRQRF
jgi:hypothetical protein